MILKIHIAQGKSGVAYLPNILRELFGGGNALAEEEDDSGAAEDSAGGTATAAAVHLLKVKLN